MKLFMKLTSIGAALLMGILNLNATHSVFAVCQGEHTIAPVLYANTRASCGAQLWR
jgi:hypothetical protein